MENDPLAALDNTKEKEWSFHVKMMVPASDSSPSASKRQALLQRLPALVLSSGQENGAWLAATFDIPQTTAYRAVTRGYEGLLQALDAVAITPLAIMDAKITPYSDAVPYVPFLDVTGAVMELEGAISEARHADPSDF